MTLIERRLESVNIEDLDAFEETYFNDYSKRMNKVDALQKIINNAEGDYSKLSDCLCEIAQDQEEQKQLLTKKSKSKMENLNPKGTIEERVKGLIAEKLGVDLEEVVNDAELSNQLGADSLDTVEVIMELEKEFNIQISDEIAEDLKTVQQHVEIIQKLYVEKLPVDLSN